MNSKNHFVDDETTALSLYESNVHRSLCAVTLFTAWCLGVQLFLFDPLSGWPLSVYDFLRTTLLWVLLKYLFETTKIIYNDIISAISIIAGCVDVAIIIYLIYLNFSGKLWTYITWSTAGPSENNTSPSSQLASQPPVYFQPLLVRTVFFTLVVPYLLRAVVTFFHVLALHRLRCSLVDYFEDQKLTANIEACLEQDVDEVTQLLDRTGLSLSRKDYEAVLAQTLAGAQNRWSSPQSPRSPHNHQLPSSLLEDLNPTGFFEQSVSSSPSLYVRAFDRDAEPAACSSKSSFTLKSFTSKITDASGAKRGNLVK